jgi:hypothetical protein
MPSNAVCARHTGRPKRADEAARLALTRLLAGRHPLPFERIQRIDRLAADRSLGVNRRCVVTRAVEIERTGQLHIELALADEAPVEPRGVGRWLAPRSVLTDHPLSRAPSSVRSIGAHSELTMRGTGENVVARSRVSSAVRHFADSCGGLTTPSDLVWTVIFQRPGSIPSAKAGGPKNSATRTKVPAAAASATLLPRNFIRHRLPERPCNGGAGRR